MGGWVWALIYSVAFYVVLLLASSVYYYAYLGGRLVGRRIALAVLLLFAVAGSLYPVYLVVRVLEGMPLLLQCLYFAVLVSVFALHYSMQASGAGCRRVREADGFYVCESSVLNAWLDPHRGKVYITTALLRVLDEREVKAVLLHEEGHRVARLLAYLGGVLSSAWLVTVAFIIASAYILRVFVRGAEAATTLLVLYMLGAVATLSVTVGLWLAEHEADLHAARGGYGDALASALVKLYAYASLGDTRLADAVRVEVDTVSLLEEAGKVATFTGIAWRLLRASLAATPATVLDLVRGYARGGLRVETHPPLPYRLRLLSRMTATG